MIKVKPNSIETVGEHNEDYCLLLSNQILQDVNGGTEEGGIKLAKRIIRKISSGEKLTHSLIIFGESYFDSNLRSRNIRAENTPFNRGLIDELDLDCNPNAIVGGSVIKLGETGLSASLGCVWNPDDELDVDEREGLKRHLRLTEKDGHEPVTQLSGILVLPKYALRATILP